MLSVNSTNSQKVESVDSKFADAEKCVQEVDFTDVIKNNEENSNSCIKAAERHLTCYRCDKSFPSYQEVVMHLKLFHNACASRDCSKISDFKMHSSVCANRGFGCSICNKKFSEKYLLLIHFNEHIDAAFYVCEICREGFQQRKDLQRHLLQIHKKNVCIPVIPSHSKAVYQKCGQCSKYFRLFAEYEEHTSSCCNSTAYACSICLVHFPTLSALDEHKFTEHKRGYAVKGHFALKCGKRYFCGLCYMGFSKGSILKKHLETHEMEVSYICDVCHSTFSCDDDLQTHYLLHIEEHYVLHDVISQHLCNSCKKTFKTQRELKNHLLLQNCINHSENFPSEESKANGYNSICIEHMATSDENTLQNDLEAAINAFDTSQIPIYALKHGEDLLNCDDMHCVIIMDLKSLFVLQRGICASESRMPDVKNSQAYDENDVIDSTLLQTHMFHILSPSSENCSSNSDSNVNTETLPYLEQDFNADTESMTINFDESIDSSIKQTDIGDGKIFYETLPVGEDSTNSEIVQETYENNLNTVELNTDNNEGSIDNVIQETQVPYNSEFTKIDEIMYEDTLHVSSGGLNVNDMHICSICKQIFSSKTSLCLHMKGRHTGFDCYRCGNSFKSDDALKNHEKLSHPGAFQCDLCEVSYPKEYLLKKHKRSAHGGKHFTCNICDKSYVLKNEYEVHLMLHRGETPPTKCEVCGKVYASISNYVRHKAIHEGKSLPKKYKCTVCDKGFVARSPLKRHLATHIKKTPLSYECPKCKMYFPPKLLSEHVESHNPSS